MLKVNLGCGIYYKPGYVNIDKYEPLVADRQADLFFLPYDDNSVDEIEASHIIEHFDIVHIPYLLAEWWRVLKPRGILCIETPNLLKSALNIIRKPYNRKIQTIRFLFGVDLPGNFHKSGFTFNLLKQILEFSGFSMIKREKSVNFRSESGIRLRMEKKSQKVNLLAKIRLQILHKFPPPNVLLYSSIESNILDVLQSASTESLTDTIIKFSMFNPQVALIVVDLLPESKSGMINKPFLEFLNEKQFHTLFYSNWIKWSKSTQNFELEFERFMNYWRERITPYFKKENSPVTGLSYIFGTTQLDSDIPCFSIEYLMVESQKLCNKALKLFQEMKLEAAIDVFRQTLRVNPANELAYWNLARIYGMKKKKHYSLEYYQIAQKLMREKTQKRIIWKEAEKFRKTHYIPEIPVQIRY